MSTYWFVYLTPLLGVLAPFRANRLLANVLWGCVAAALILFIGLRHEVGMDWLNYVEQFEVIDAAAEHGPVWINEPGYVLLTWVSARLGLGLHGVNFVCAALFSLGLLAFARRQPLPWMALAVAIPYLVIIVAMNNTRQSVALGMLFLGLLALERERMKTFGVLIMAAAMFHASALACLFFAALKLRRTHLRPFLTILAVGLVIGVGFLAELYDRYASLYGADTQHQSAGAAVRLGINVLAYVTLLVLRRRWTARFGWDKLWFWMGIGSLLLLPFVAVASTAVDRVSLYLMPLQIYVWSRAPALIATPLWRTLVIFGIAGFYATVLWVWLAFAINSSAWIPYQNVLLYTG